MPSSLANVLVHLVFSTKQRHPFLVDPTHRQSMHRYLAEVSNQLRCPTISVGGVTDHVHILAREARTVTLAEWVKELKRVSSIWAKTLGADLADFQWQEGYGAFSVSQALSGEVQLYIEGQEERHRSSSFEDELRMLLKQHKIEYDEHHLWD